jgi:hypothetical protein
LAAWAWGAAWVPGCCRVAILAGSRQPDPATSSLSTRSRIVASGSSGNLRAKNAPDSRSSGRSFSSN